MFRIFKTKRKEKVKKQPTGNIIDFEQKRREKKRFSFFKPYELFGKSHEFTNWIHWHQHKR